MGLIKSYTNSSNQVGDYWGRLSFGRANYIDKIVDVFLYLYTDKASRDAGDDPYLTEKFEFTGSDLMYTFHRRPQ